MEIVKLIMLFTSITLMVSCEKQSKFKQLNGDYTYYKYDSWENGLYEESIFQMYSFDETNIGFHSFEYWAYLPQSGWINPSKEGTNDMIEWKIEDGEFYDRPCCIESDWYKHNFEFINENSFIMDGILFEK